MQSGLRPTRADARDYDLIKSEHPRLYAGLASLPSFPAEFDVDAGLWVPNQLEPQAFTGLPNIPALPFGCTSYSQSDLCVDDDGRLYNPMDLEAITHANAQGGAEIRVALDAAKKAFGRTAYFNIRPSGIIDAFDAARLAMYSGQPEKRAVSVGSIWYNAWMRIGSDGILSMPSVLRILGPWHNWVICGWVTINGVLYLKGKSWQGPEFGKGGFHYISREVFNSIMSVPGTVMFTITNLPPSQIQTVDMNIVERIMSFMRNLIAALTPSVAPQEPATDLPVIHPPHTPPVPIEPPVDRLKQFCEALRDYEGKPGDRNYKNNNPGNCRYSSVGYASIYGVVKKDKNNFAIFKDYATGFLYLENLIRSKVQKNPKLTIRTLMAEYAPTSDNNNPVAYAQNLAHRMGVDIDYPIKNFL